jgi:flagellar hook-associated protein 1 FlgK
MGGSALMSLGTKALFANYAALQTTGNNISNANTKGYSRQTVELESAGGQFSGAGFFGKGVNVATVARAHSEFLTREAANSASIAAADEARSAQLQQLEKVFASGEQGIGYAAGQFLNAFVDVANRPQDTSARQVVLSRAAELASRFRHASDQIGALQAGVTADLKTSITAVNTLAKKVADTNTQITAALASGHQPNDLLDQRDRLIGEISSYVQVTAIGADDGSMSLFIGGGQKLVLGSDATTLSAVPDAFDVAKLHVGLTDASGGHPFPDDLMGGGSIAGLLRFQRDDLTDARNLLGQMAAALAGRVNSQQALGLDLGQPPSTGAPIFSTGAPGVAPATSNAKNPNGSDVASVQVNGIYVPTVSLTITNPTELRASDYELRNDPAVAGNYLLTRLSDGTVSSVASGATVDGFQLNVIVPLPVAGDRFLLRPVGLAAGSMSRALDDPKGIAAASQVTASTGTTNTGTATVADVHATSSAINPQLTATISFTSNNGAYDWELRDRTTNALVSNGSATWTAGQPISMNGWDLSLNGVPKSGDTVVVEKTVFPGNNNGNARALTDLRDARIVGQQTSVTTTVPGETITDAYASAMSDIGVRVQGARTSAEMSASVATSAETLRSAKAGVNLDEEAARLIQFQQSYQAAAKMLQVAQQVFDTLLETAGR